MKGFQQAIYKTEDGKRLLRKSFCAYFDILGFTEKIKTNDLKFFEKYLVTLDEVIKYLNEHHDLNGKEDLKTYELKIFTDNFVLGHPWYDEFGESELGTIFDAISHIQLTFALSNVFIRGAIAMSDLFMDENIVLGPALVEAYQLENSIAVYPRVILSTEVQIIVNKHINYYAVHSDSPQSEEYLTDTDGQVFINYLSSSVRDSYGEEKIIKEKLLRHKDVIIENLLLYNENHKLLSKFIWLAEYHNFFCANNLDRFEEIDIASLLVEEKYFKKSIKKIV